MKIELLQMTKDPLDLLWIAARTCTSRSGALDLRTQTGDISQAEKIKLVRKVLGSGHMSVAEHVSMTYGIEEVSRTLLAQITRHRIGTSFSVQSQRYVKNDGKAYFPKAITDRPDWERLYRDGLESARKSYDNMIEAGMPAQYARMILPGGALTNITMTVNLRSLQHMYIERVIHPGAQEEIRRAVMKMGELMEERLLAVYGENWMHGIIVPEVF